MKITDKDRELFNALAKSSLGKDFSDYCERLMNSICDSRNWKEGEDKNSANMAARNIKEYIKDKLSLIGKGTPSLTNEAE